MILQKMTDCCGRFKTADEKLKALEAAAAEKKVETVDKKEDKVEEQ